MNQTTKKPQDIEQEQSYLYWCQTLVKALKRLSLAAQTTGGTAGPDAELQAAIAEAERAMSPGACSAAIDKAEEAPTPLPPPIFSQAHSDAMYRAGMILAGKMPQPSAPSVSADAIHLAIPQGVYYVQEADNFYDASTRTGLGSGFYNRWHERCREFPYSPDAAIAAQSKEGGAA